MKTYVITFIFLICSCVQPTHEKIALKEDSLRVKENELLRKEVLLKEKELQISKEVINSKSIELPITEIYKQVRKGIFLIFTKKPNGISQGTGFFLNCSGVGISNYHVFENADSALVILDNSEEYLISDIINFNKDLDYIIFKINCQRSSCYPFKFPMICPKSDQLVLRSEIPEG